ncbi:glycosyltransferase family 2 protein [Acidobacteria bacterium AH-259-D05]|nr:glycosyltransferase family 2 protein [Acidobacteria bacterium AH-259-D05]
MKVDEFTAVGHTDVRNAPVISVVVPAFNEEDNLPHLCERLKSVLAGLGKDYEIIVVDDASSDGTLALLQQLHSHESRIHYVSLSRNFGHQSALVAGLEYSRGDVVISMDADLQHPPELIPKMLNLWEKGYEVVWTKKNNSGSIPLLKRLGMYVQYTILRRLAGIQLDFGQSDFRLLDRKVVLELCCLPERDKFLRGLVEWIGFRQVGVSYEVQSRFAGKPKYSVASRLRLLTSGIVSFTFLPLRVFTVFGLLVASLSFLYGLLAVILGTYAFLTGYGGGVVPGWASVAIAVYFLGGIQLIGIGLLGEYIGRAYNEAKQRPTYIVREASTPRVRG